jgi:hypothetical protein
MKLMNWEARWWELVTHMDIFGVPRKTISKVLRPLFEKFKLGKKKVNEIQAYIDKPMEGPEVKISIMGDSTAEKNTYYLRTKDGGHINQSEPPGSDPVRHLETSSHGKVSVVLSISESDDPFGDLN